MKNMKNTLLINVLIAACMVLAGCDDNYETIFPETPDDRVRKSLEEYNTLLMSAPYGWKASLYTGTGAGYFYYLDFNENGSVTMLSDFNQSAAGEPMTSEWVVKALQRPTLSFTSYSYIHLPADPDGNINNGIPGSGLLSDFEFSFTTVTDDTVVMTGLRHESEIRLVRATEGESEAYNNKRIQELLISTENYLALHRGYRLRLPNGTEVPIALSLPYKLISFQFVENGTIQIPTTSYFFSIEGIVLKQAIRIGEYDVDKLVWDDNTQSYYVPFAEAATLIGSDDPFILEPSTPLHQHLGHELVTVVIPGSVGTDPLPGQSDGFTVAYNEAANDMLQGAYRLTLEEIKFAFIPSTDRMLMVLTVSQPVAGGGVARFTAQYLYSYQLRDGGILKFRQEGMDDNGNILYLSMSRILAHFDNDTFKFQYVGGGLNLIAAFFSQEEPGYYFSGYVME